MSELRMLWGKLLGEVPSDQQFAFWSAAHSPEVIKQGILKTAQKNLSVGGMSDDHRIRFASKVMLTLSARREEHAANRERLRQEFDGRAARSQQKGGL